MYEWWFAPPNPSEGVMKYLKEPSQRAARWIRRAILETTTLDLYDDMS